MVLRVSRVFFPPIVLSHFCIQFRVRVAIINSTTQPHSHCHVKRPCGSCVMIIPVTVIRGFRTLISQKRRQEIIRARGSTGDHLQSHRRRRRRRGFRTRGTPEKWDRRSNSKSVCSARMCGVTPARRESAGRGDARNGKTGLEIETVGSRGRHKGITGAPKEAYIYIYIRILRYRGMIDGQCMSAYGGTIAPNIYLPPPRRRTATNEAGVSGSLKLHPFSSYTLYTYGDVIPDEFQPLPPRDPSRPCRPRFGFRRQPLFASRPTSN